MSPQSGGGLDALLTADTVLGQIEAAVLVTDRLGHLRYANTYAAGLFGLPDDAGRLAGLSVLSLLCEEGAPGQAAGDGGTAAGDSGGMAGDSRSPAGDSGGMAGDSGGKAGHSGGKAGHSGGKAGHSGGKAGHSGGLVRQVLEDGGWDGTLTSVRPDGSRVAVQAQAVPLRDSAGAIDGIVVIARRAARRTSPREHDRIGLLEQIGERLAGSLELDVTLRHVAEALVPQFADHCFIDLFHGDKLLRRAQINARGWAPPAGSWARVGEQVAYPDGHFCQQAMAELEPVIGDLRSRRYPTLNAKARRANEEVGLVSVIAAPLCVRGELLGVMSL